VALQDLGFARATDIVGGFEAWRARGLPVRPARAAPRTELLGMGDPEPAEDSDTR
jgi:hypothetical protein